MSFPASWRAPALLLALWLIWGYNWVVSKTGLHWMGALEFAVGRTVLATLTLGLILLGSRRALAPPPWRATLWLGLTQTTGFTGLTHLALVAGGAGKVSVLVASHVETQG
jgi:drug/metabolite transporter (DMT)-like permease